MSLRRLRRVRAVANLVPLNWQIPITNPGGTPTTEFQRAWSELQSTTGSIPALDTAAEVSAILDKIGATPGSLLHRGASGWQIITGANGDFIRRGAAAWSTVTTLSAVQALLDTLSSTHGAVLFRGTAGWEALAPGTAGNFLQTAGAGADPLWAAGGGGGGGGNIVSPALANGSVSANSAAFACKGNTFYCGISCHVTKVYSAISSLTAGTTYRCDFFTCNTSGNTLTSAAIGSVTVTGVTGNSLMTFDFSASPVALTAGNNYAVLITGTAATSDTSICNIYGGSAITPFYNELVGGHLAPVPTSIGNYSRVTSATRNPVNGTSISPTLNNMHIIHLEGTVP